MRRPDAYARLADVRSNITVSPARRARSVAMHARISSSVAGFRPILRADGYPVPTTTLMRPGAISSTAWLTLPRTAPRRRSGALTGGNNAPVALADGAGRTTTDRAVHTT